MQLGEFIKTLEKVRCVHGDNLEVVMADNLSVEEPVVIAQGLHKEVVITDVPFEGDVMKANGGRL